MSRLLFKDTVRPRSLHIVCAAANIADEYNFPDIVITSGNDSQHMQNSLHYSDNAIDLRSKNFPSAEAKKMFLRLLIQRLGPDYQAILESEGKINEHFHIEFDPNGNH